MNNLPLDNVRVLELGTLIAGPFTGRLLGDFGAEVMVDNKSLCGKKYSGLTLDNTTLEEIMLYYVNKDKKEWWQ